MITMVTSSMRTIFFPEVVNILQIFSSEFLAVSLFPFCSKIFAQRIFPLVISGPELFFNDLSLFFRFPIVIYLMSVYNLEKLRITMCADIETFNKLFDYLEDRAIQVDKTNIYDCVLVIVNKLFQVR